MWNDEQPFCIFRAFFFFNFICSNLGSYFSFHCDAILKKITYRYFLNKVAVVTEYQKCYGILGQWSGHFFALNTVPYVEHGCSNEFDPCRLVYWDEVIATCVDANRKGRELSFVLVSMRMKNRTIILRYSLRYLNNDRWINNVNKSYQ